MSSVKKFNSNLIIQSSGVSSNITIDAETVIIPGNLTVEGTTTTISTINTTIKDNIIILNDGETGAGVTQRAGEITAGSGIIVDRGTLPSVLLGWNEDEEAWQISSNIANIASYTTILTSASALTAIVQDTSPELGGNLSVNGFAIESSGYNTVLTGNIQLNNTLAIPGAQPNSTVVYASTPNAGQSGVYVVNQTSTNEELVTKRRAFGFSLIL